MKSVCKNFKIFKKKKTKNVIKMLKKTQQKLKNLKLKVMNYLKKIIFQKPK